MVGWEGWSNDKMHLLQAGFVAISLAVREMYQMITMGGDASLEAKDTIDPFSEGIVFMVGDISILIWRDLLSQCVIFENGHFPKYLIKSLKISDYVQRAQMLKFGYAKMHFL